jgi:integrase/recombinase XerC
MELLCKTEFGRRMRGYVSEIAELAGVPDATPHRWRHSTATLALERTGNLRGVQDFLGHASLQSTQLYTAVLPSRLTEIVLALDP